jgi:hypothetical protein
MNKIIIFSTLLLTFVSCVKPLKNIEDYFPEIELSAKTLDDGSVLVEGKYIKQGAGSIDKQGFSYSYFENGEITENQVLLNGDDVFSHIYPAGFFPDSTYYFKAFSDNNFGYVFSNTVKLTDIKAIPVVAPCAVTPGTLYVEPFSYSVVYNPAYHSFDYVEYNCYGSFSGQGKTANFRFKKPPLTGVYTTKAYLGEDDKAVVFSISNGFDNGLVSYEKSVYVNRIDANNFKIEICDATWKIGTTSFDVKCNFTRPY